MDGEGFDDLARRLGAGIARRGLLKTLAGGALAAAGYAVGVGPASAGTRRRSVGNSCKANADCASNLCVSEGRTRKICHCQLATDCTAGNDACHASVCHADGSCASTTVVCTPLDQCHVAGTCNPATGQCDNPPAQDGAICDDGDACTTGDVCLSGVCQGTATVCDDNNACTADSCDPQTGKCVHAAIACNECAIDPDCPTGSLCQHGGCFVITVAFGIQQCNDSCAGNSDIAGLNGSFVCVASGAGAVVCSTDADCPLGWACLSNVFCVAPC